MSNRRASPLIVVLAVVVGLFAGYLLRGSRTSQAPARSLVTVPNVVGMRAEAARNAILSAGLTLGAVPATGTVVAQRPAPGSKVLAGSETVVEIAHGRVSSPSARPSP